MLDAPGHQDDLTFPDLDGPILEAHFHSALDDIEQFVAVFVGVHDELALELRQIDLQAVPFRDQMRMPLFREQRELVSQVDGFHGDVSLRPAGLIFEAP